MGFKIGKLPWLADLAYMQSACRWYRFQPLLSARPTAAFRPA